MTEMMLVRRKNIVNMIYSGEDGGREGRGPGGTDYGYACDVW